LAICLLATSCGRWALITLVAELLKHRRDSGGEAIITGRRDWPPRRSFPEQIAHRTGLTPPRSVSNGGRAFTSLRPIRGAVAISKDRKRRLKQRRVQAESAMLAGKMNSTTTREWPAARM